MKVVVDTNIIFSAVLNSKGNIGNILFNSGNTFQFFSCAFMLAEIKNHWEKIKLISGLEESVIEKSLSNVLKNINFISEDSIPSEIWISSEMIS